MEVGEGRPRLHQRRVKMKHGQLPSEQSLYCRYQERPERSCLIRQSQGCWKSVYGAEAAAQSWPSMVEKSVEWRPVEVALGVDGNSQVVVRNEVVQDAVDLWWAILTETQCYWSLFRSTTSENVLCWVELGIGAGRGAVRVEEVRLREEQVDLAHNGKKTKELAHILHS